MRGGREREELAQRNSLSAVNSYDVVDETRRDDLRTAVAGARALKTCQ